VWSDVRANFKSLARRVEQQGDWEVVAGQWRLSRDIFWESAHLGLIETPFGRELGRDIADALLADDVPRDRNARAALARDGFVLTWWDIVALAECVGFAFVPIDTTEADLRRYGRNGQYSWDRRNLIDRIGRATESQAPAPDELHRRITADGRVKPPAVGSKYRAMFERLDDINFVGAQATVTISREELDELLSRAEFGEKRSVRGARGQPGLPPVALKTASWWYGPWNPSEADRDSTWAACAEPSWSAAMQKKSQARAWMAAGLRATPIIPSGSRKLVSVRFEPVDGRESWWPWREKLRDGSFNQVSLERERER
jgi:hypothetical protein